MTPRRESLSMVESPRGDRASKRTTAARAFTVRWRLDARTAACVMQLPNTERLPLHAEASFECRFTLTDREVEAATFTLRAPEHEQVMLELSPRVNAVVIERSGTLHVDLYDESGSRVLAMSSSANGDVEFAQSTLFETLGIPAGRYDTASISVTSLSDSSNADASIDAA